jgi:hypothetical protein
MNFTISIADLTRKAFGFDYLRPYRISGTTLGTAEVAYKAGLLPDSYEKDINGAPIVGLLGRPVQMSIEFGDVEYQGRKYNGIKLLDPIMDITQETIITRTSIPGSVNKGTYKEYITNGDYSVSLQGLLVSNTDEKPIQEIIAFNEYFNLPIALPVANSYLNALGIYYLVKVNKGFPNVNVISNCQPFRLDLISDEPIEVEVME